MNIEGVEKIKKQYNQKVVNIQIIRYIGSCRYKYKMLSQNRKQQSYVSQLFSIVKFLQQHIIKSDKANAQLIQELFEKLNSTLCKIQVTNINDLNLLITKQLQVQEQRNMEQKPNVKSQQNLQRNCQSIQEENGSKGQFLSMYNTIETFCNIFIEKVSQSKINQKQSLGYIYDFFGCEKINYAFLRELIWDQRDRNAGLRRDLINELVWVVSKPVASQKNNNIYYQCLNLFLEILNQETKNRVFPLESLIQHIFFLSTYKQSINTSKLLDLIRIIIQQILLVLKQSLNQSRDKDKQAQKVKSIQMLKTTMEGIFKYLESDTRIYKYQTVGFRKEMQTFINQAGLCFMNSTSVAIRLAGLRLLGVDSVDERTYFEWLNENKVMDIILAQTQKQAFINNSGTFFRLFLKNLNLQPTYLSKILEFTKIAKNGIRKSVLKYLQNYSLPDYEIFYEEIIEFLLMQQHNMEFLTQQVFDIVLKYTGKLSVGFNEKMLSRLLELYLIFPGLHNNKNATLGCQNAIIQSILKVCERKVFGQQQNLQKFEKIFNIFNTLLLGQFSLQIVTLFCKLVDKIFQAYSFKQQNKQKLAQRLVSQGNILTLGCEWISKMESKKHVEKLQRIIIDLLSRLTDQSKMKLIKNIEMLVFYARNVKIFKKILSFSSKSEYLNNSFEQFILQCYNNYGIQSQNPIKCIRIYLLMINQSKIQSFEPSDYFQTTCLASQIQGIKSLTECLMKLTLPKAKDQIAQLLSDIYTRYSYQIKEEAEEYLISIFGEVISVFEDQFCLVVSQGNFQKVSGVLALIKNLIMATEILGIGRYPAHNSQALTNTVSIRIVNQIRRISANHNRLYQKRLPSSWTLMDVLNQVCVQFKCDFFEIELRQSDNKLIPLRCNGLNLQQLKLDGKRLKIVQSQINLSQKKRQLLIRKGCLNPKLKQILSQLYHRLSINGQMKEEQVKKFIQTVTKNICISSDQRITKFIKQNDDDNDGNITLENFLHFYHNQCNQNNGKIVWTNLLNIGYRYDLKKNGEYRDCVEQRLLFRSHLAKSQSVYDTLFSLTKSSNQSVRERGAQILFRLPSRNPQFIKIPKIDFNLVNNIYQIEYYLIQMQNQLKHKFSQQYNGLNMEKKENFLNQEKVNQVFKIMNAIFEIENKKDRENNSLHICIKILRSLCPVPCLAQEVINSHIQQSWNSFQLPKTAIFIKLLKGSIEKMNIQEIESLFALQLTQNSGIQLNTLISAAVFNNSLVIRQIAGNFLFLAGLREEQFGQMLQQKVKEQYCDIWYETLAKIIQKNMKINLSKVSDACFANIQNRKQTLRQIFDPILFGNLQIILSVANHDPSILSFQKLIHIAENTISNSTRRLIYKIMWRVDKLNSIVYVKQLIKNCHLDSSKQLCPKSQYIGLNNLGSTCYINSVLQLLFWLKKFRKQFLNINLPIDVEQRKQLSQVIKQTRNIFTYLQCGYNKFYNMSNFCQVYRTKQMEPIDVKQQEDAHQFYSHFLQIMENYFINAEKKNLFQKLFICKSLFQYVCKECEHRVKREEDFFCLNLQVKGYNTFEQSLIKLTRPQQICDYTCESCKKKVQVTKLTKFSSVPEYLIVNLNRISYNFEIGQHVKISSKLSFPEFLDLKQFILSPQKNEQSEYKIKAVIIHLGTCESGHYYLIVRINNKWFKFDDKSVTEYSFQQMKNEGEGESEGYEYWDQQKHTKCAYILCYEKKGVKQEQNSEKYHKDSQILKLIKSENKNLTTQLKVCNDTSFEFAIQLWRQLRPEKTESYDSYIEKNSIIFSNLLDLSVTLLKFLGKFWKLNNPSIFHQLGSQILCLYNMLPEQVQNFFNEVNTTQCIQMLCLHQDTQIKDIFKNVLAKCLHIWYTHFRYDYEDNEPVVEKTRDLVYSLKKFITEKTFYENIYHLQAYFEFWQLCLENIQSIKLFLINQNFLLILIEMLMCKSEVQELSPGQTVNSQKKTESQKLRVLPTNISQTITKLVQILFFYKIMNKSIDIGVQETQLIKKFNEEEYQYLINAELYSNIIKNNYDPDKNLCSVIGRICLENQLFSKQLAQIFLKGFKIYQQKNDNMSILLEYVTYFLAINDNLRYNRIKWILGIPQLQMDNLNFGFKQNIQSNLYCYKSTLYFSQYQKYKPILQILWSHSQPYCFKQSTPYFFYFFINICLTNEKVYELLSVTPSPVCYCNSYLSWLKVYFKKLESIQQKSFPMKKHQFFQISQNIYQDLSKKIQQKMEQLPVNKYIIGNNKNLQVRWEQQENNYKVLLLQHETYFLKNQPTGQKNLSISPNFFYSSKSNFFLLNGSQNEKNRSQMQHQQSKPQTMKSMYTLQIQTQISLKLTFNLPNYTEQIYLQNGKNHINFPYSPIIWKQGNLSDIIEIEKLQIDQVKWSNRKYSHAVEKNTQNKDKVSVIVSQPTIITDIREKIHCSACTFLNDIYDSVCEICGSSLS